MEPTRVPPWRRAERAKNAARIGGILIPPPRFDEGLNELEKADGEDGADNCGENQLEQHAFLLFRSALARMYEVPPKIFPSKFRIGSVSVSFTTFSARSSALSREMAQGAMLSRRSAC